MTKRGHAYSGSTPVTDKLWVKFFCLVEIYLPWYAGAPKIEFSCDLMVTTSKVDVLIGSTDSSKSMET